MSHRAVGELWRAKTTRGGFASCHQNPAILTGVLFQLKISAELTLPGSKNSGLRKRYRAIRGLWKFGSGSLIMEKR